ncbi:carboxypeptidase-like regulatory domain-containing protein [Ciceribacter sp. L1K22]|uniref:carboxypeptidase-like regulatory domain-containing protein n=1 Tax=Ciceribacter sp. L1K22 TaxID=2820275 RepID=UPI001ABDBF30|nr:carboxypeptidase-like regulatory domain-containing protein [Ciceribacter sp. L1K22]MBO3760806.1 carboxypeptidase regulatory-like domain-containing protein [Ciceribacter sp. L1K22]
MSPRALLPALLAAVALPSAALAQSAEVTGEVKTPTAEPLAGVPVIIEGPEGKSVLFTDKEGRWTLYNAPAGDYSVQAVVPDERVADVAPTVPFSIEEKGFFKSFGSDSITNVEPLITSPQY